MRRVAIGTLGQALPCCVRHADAWGLGACGAARRGTGNVASPPQQAPVAQPVEQHGAAHSFELVPGTLLSIRCDQPGVGVHAAGGPPDSVALAGAGVSAALRGAVIGEGGWWADPARRPPLTALHLGWHLPARMQKRGPLRCSPRTYHRHHARCVPCPGTTHPEPPLQMRCQQPRPARCPSSCRRASAA